MPIAEILEEIDAYLVCLRHARDLLATDTKVPMKSERRPTRTVKIQKIAANVSTVRRIQKSNLRSRHSAPRAEALNDSQIGDVAAKLATPQQLPMPASKREQQGVIEITRLPSKRPRGRSAHASRTRRALGTQLESVKPAIALAAPTNSRIVVVPAEQLRQERDRAAHTEPPRSRVRAIGLTGRLAFEALFKDSTDPSNGAEH